MALPVKTVSQLLAEYEERRATTRARLNAGMTSNRTTAPSDRVELGHAQQIEDGARIMRGKGYAVSIDRHPPHTAVLHFSGPTPGVWAGEAATQTLTECPSYVSPEDYALACYEQYVE